MLQSLGLQNPMSSENPVSYVNQSQAKMPVTNSEIYGLTKQIEELKIAMLDVRTLNNSNKHLPRQQNRSNDRPQYRPRSQYRNRQPTDWSKVKCFRCEKMGHTAKFCRENIQQHNMYNKEYYNCNFEEGEE